MTECVNAPYRKKGLRLEGKGSGSSMGMGPKRAIEHLLLEDVLGEDVVPDKESHDHRGPERLIPPRLHVRGADDVVRHPCLQRFRPRQRDNRTPEWHSDSREKPGLCIRREEARKQVPPKQTQGHV